MQRREAGVVDTFMYVPSPCAAPSIQRSSHQVFLCHKACPPPLNEEC